MVGQKLAFPMMCPYFTSYHKSHSSEGCVECKKPQLWFNCSSYRMRDAPHDLFAFIPETLAEESCCGATRKGTMHPVLCVLEEKVNILYNIHC